MASHWRLLFKRINKGSGLPRKHILLVIVSPPSIQVAHTPLSCPYVFQPPNIPINPIQFPPKPHPISPMERHQKQQTSLKLLLSHMPPAQSPTSSTANIAAATAAAATGDPPADQKAALDFNVVVILAAMLCALVCALGLHSMLQCVVRCTQRVVTDPVGWVAARRLNTGLKKEDVVAIPISTYAAPPTSSPASAAAGCAICLADFSDGDKIRVIPKCSHRFHVACIDTWLMAHSSCPTCRHRLSNNSHNPSSSGPAHLQILTSLST
ncbi:hypothetical protein ACLOJK_041488 [Asimina triloba]